MSVYTEAERADAAALIHKLLAGTAPAEAAAPAGIATLGEIAAAIGALGGWIRYEVAGGTSAKWVALQAAAGADYIEAAARGAAQ